MDKWYADIPPLNQNYTVADATFLINTNQKTVQQGLNGLVAVVPGGRYKTVTNYMSQLSLASNAVISSWLWNLEAFTTLVKFNRGLAFSFTETAPPNPQPNEGSNIVISYTKTEFTPLALSDLQFSLPPGVAPPLSTNGGRLSALKCPNLAVGEKFGATTPQPLITGGGLEQAWKIKLSPLSPTIIFAGLINEAKTKSVGIEVDCNDADPTITLFAFNTDTGLNVSVPVLLNPPLTDPFLFNPYGSFRIFQSAGTMKIRYEIPKSASNIKLTDLQIGGTYTIARSGVAEASWAIATGLPGPYLAGQTFVCVAIPPEDGINAFVYVPQQNFDLMVGQPANLFGPSEAGTEVWYGIYEATLTDGPAPVPLDEADFPGLSVNLPLENDDLGDPGIISGAGTYVGNPVITAAQYTAIVTMDFTAQLAIPLQSQLGVPPFVVLTQGAPSGSGTFTSTQAINFNSVPVETELALEIVDLPLHSYTAEVSAQQGARTNVVAYFIPQAITTNPTRYTWSQSLYQWLYIDSKTDIQLTSLSFRVFYPYAPNIVFQTTQMSFNLLVEDRDEFNQ
tara:strand:- start:3821 stop:5512 length:1692 start_codon:yes stop_codon:yes gene_type:complete